MSATINAGNFAPDAGTKKIVTIVVLLIVAIMIWQIAKRGFGVTDGILQGLGLQDSAEEKENKTFINNEVNRQNAMGIKSPWSPKYYTNVPRGGGFAFTVEEAQKLCKQIWDSVGYLYDTPSKAAGAIKQCKNKRNLSFLADGMSDIYGVDLLNWLESKFDTSEQREILAGLLRFANSLPAA
jgi:hypothetical protein